MSAISARSPGQAARAAPSTSAILHHPAMRKALPFINGGLAGCIATIVIQPIDMVNLNL